MGNDWWMWTALQCSHNGRDGISNHQPHDCLLSRLFRPKLKKTSKLRVTGLCAGNSPVIGEFHAQRASNAENVSIWWRHHVHEYQTSYFSFSVEAYASQPAILGFEIYLRPNPRNIVILSKFSSLAGNGCTGSWQNDNFRFSKRQFFSARRWYSRSNVMVQKYPSLHVFVTTVLYAKTRYILPRYSIVLMPNVRGLSRHLDAGLSVCRVPGPLGPHRLPRAVIMPPGRSVLCQEQQIIPKMKRKLGHNRQIADYCLHRSSPLSLSLVAIDSNQVPGSGTCQISDRK